MPLCDYALAGSVIHILSMLFPLQESLWCCVMVFCCYTE